jgi:hypothetical protein
MAGALLAGWDEIVGVEQDEEYCKIAEARLKFWQTNAGRGKTTAEILHSEPEKPGTMTLFGEI